MAVPRGQGGLAIVAEGVKEGFSGAVSGRHVSQDREGLECHGGRTGYQVTHLFPHKGERTSTPRPVAGPYVPSIWSLKEPGLGLL